MAVNSAVAIFNDALSISLTDRSQFLQAACGGDPGLIAEIVSLLAAHDAAKELPALPFNFPPVEPGSRLGGFVIVREIGRGGMGIVYLAEDVRLRRRLAIKTLFTWLGEDAQRLARLEREAQVLASLNHPNIGTLYALEEAEGVCYLVLELVEGRSLSDELRSGPIPVPRALDLCRQVAAALANAHARGVVHRDLKPANVMVTPESVVKLVDFGLAKVLSESEPAQARGVSFDDWSSQASSVGGRTGAQAPTGNTFTHGAPCGLAGTPGYMSPEQLRGLSFDHRADFWSFGCILYECLTGQLAFPGESPAERISATLEGRPEWTLLPMDVPESIRAILRACLAVDPMERPASTDEVLSIVTDAASSRAAARTQSISSTPDPPLALRLGTSRNRVALFGVGVLAVVVAGSLTLVKSRVAEPARPEFRQVSFDGDLVDFTVSPDGSRVAYTTWTQELVIRDLGTGKEARRPMRLVSPLDWSPSGSEILAVLAPYVGADVRQTVAVPVEGGEPRQLGPPEFYGMTWSPDGTRIAGILRQAPGLGSLSVLHVATGEIDPIPVDELGAIGRMQWSPAGECLLIETTERATWTVEIEGGAAERVDSGFATWGPHGESILFLSVGPGWRGLSQVGVDPIAGRPTGVPDKLCDIQQSSRVVVSRNGRRVFVLQSHKVTNVWRLDLTLDETRRSWERLLFGTQERDFPRISPNGSQVAFLEHEARGEAKNDVLVVHDLNDPSKEPRVLLGAVGGNPAWSPDGSEIAIQRVEPESSRIWTIRADGHTRRLDAISGSEHLSWVAGRGILFQPPEYLARNFAIMDPLSGESSLVFAHSDHGTAFQVRASPDGTHLAVAGNRGGIQDVRTWIVRLSDGSETLLWDHWAGPVGWSRDSNAVYVIAADPGSPESWRRSIFRLPATGGEAEFVADLPGPVQRWSGVDVSQDGGVIVCAIDEGQSDLWLVENLRID